MHAIALVDSLVEFIKEVVKQYNLATKIEGVNKTPDVYPGYLPPKDDDDEELVPNDYPFVIVRYVSEDDEISDKNTIRVRLIIGTRSDDEQNGWRDTVNIATRIKIELKKKMIIDSFSLTGKVQTELFEEQLRPYWHAVMELEFESPQVQYEWSDNFG